MKFNKNISYYFALSLFKISLLCSSVTCSEGISDDQLEREIAGQYKAFKGLTIKNVNGPVCKAVQFVYSLMQNDQDQHLGQKLALILRQGAGIGGLRTKGPVANEAERSILFAGINKAKQKGVKRDGFISKPSVDPNDILAHHQQYIRTVYDVLNEKTDAAATDPSILDFVQSPQAYQSFNTKVKLYHAVKTNNWRDLIKEVPNPVEFLSQVRQFSMGSHVDYQMKVMRDLTAFPSDQRDTLINQAKNFRYWSSSDYDYQMKVMRDLTAFPFDQREALIKQAKEFRYWSSSDYDYQMKVMRDLAAFPSDQRETLIEQAKKFRYWSVENYDYQMKVMRGLAALPLDQRETLIKQAERIALYLATNTGDIIIAFSSIPFDQWDGFAGQAEKLDRRQILKLAIHYINLLPSILLPSIKIIAETPEEQREQFIAQILQVVSWSKLPCIREELIKRLNQLPTHEQRQHLVSHIMQLASLAKNGDLVDDLIKAPSYVSKQAIRLAVPGMGSTDLSAIIKQLKDIPDETRCHEFVDEVVRLITPQTERNTRKKIIEIVLKVPYDQRHDFVNQLLRIVTPMTTGHREQTFGELQRLNPENLSAFVNFLADRRITDPAYIAALTYYASERWASRLAELERLRRQQTLYSPVTIVTPNQVYKTLDDQPLQINREALVSWRLPEITTTTYTASQMDKALQSVLDGLNLTDPTKQGYLSTHLFDGELHEKVGEANKAHFNAKIVPKIKGFLKTLWNMPLNKGEEKGWEMYERDKPALQKALSYILENMKMADPDTRMMLFLQLANGLLHCPTGQKEAVDSVVQSLLTQDLISTEEFHHKLVSFLALKKNNTFRQAILSGDNSQNVHILSYYFTQLKETLGLSSALGNFVEKIGRMGEDPFRGSNGNALQAFYNQFTPAFLVDVVFSQIQTKSDFALHDRILSLDAAITAEKNADRQQALMAQKTTLQKRYRQVTRLERPFHPFAIYTDLVESNHLSTTEPEGWKRYFSDDPLSEGSFELTLEGAKRYLIDKEILIQHATIQERDDWIERLVQHLTTIEGTDESIAKLRAATTDLLSSPTFIPEGVNKTTFKRTLNEYISHEGKAQVLMERLLRRKQEMAYEVVQRIDAQKKAEKAAVQEEDATPGIAGSSIPSQPQETKSEQKKELTREELRQKRTEVFGKK